MNKKLTNHETGAVHIYTGKGKGKTTAAMGLALRAAGAGLKVCFIQFLKGGEYAEHDQLQRIENITLKKFGRDCLIRSAPRKIDKQEAREGMETVKTAAQNGEYDVVIADEISVALTLGLITEADILGMMDNKLQSVELIITGRGATRLMIDKADLVTEMKEIKHYYQKGRLAKKGIEY